MDVLKALSDKTRLRILNLLYEKELCVCDIMETLQIFLTLQCAVPQEFVDHLSIQNS